MTGREMTAHIQSMSSRCRTEARWHVDGRGVLAPLSETGFHSVPTMCCHDPALYSLEPHIQVYRSPCRLSGSSEFIMSRLLQCRDLAARAPDVSVVVQSSHRLSSSCRWSVVDCEINRIDVDVEANALVQRPHTDRICGQICGLCQPHVEIPKPDFGRPEVVAKTYTSVSVRKEECSGIHKQSSRIVAEQLYAFLRQKIICSVFP